MYNLSEIKKQFYDVICFSQDIPDPQLDTLFEDWLEAKRDIIEAFGGELIKEVPTPVNFHLDAKTRKTYFNDFVSHVQTVYGNRSLVDFLNANADGFYDNTVQVAYEAEDFKIPEGMKIIKAFKFFEKNKQALEDLQNQASQLIQEDLIEGTLCFSVHPLDFLSISVNTYNWRSCHALDGEFRAGNLSYMCDKSTIVCYLRGADNVNIPMFPPEVKWNSKKWRVLFYLSDGWDMIFASKPYPFISKAGLNIALEHLLPALKLEHAYLSDWHSDYLSTFQRENGTDVWLKSPYVPVARQLIALDEMVLEPENPLHFNDVLRSSTYKKPYYTVKDGLWWYEGNNKPIFHIGKDIKCLCCGEKRILDSELMACRTCADTYNLYGEEVAICDCCGSHVHEDEFVWVQDQIVCDRCFRNECFMCDCCEEYYFNENKVYDSDEEEYLCIHCYNSRKGR